MRTEMVGNKDRMRRERVKILKEAGKCETVHWHKRCDYSTHERLGKLLFIKKDKIMNK